ncbi:hypothetical protein Pla22_42360 [Rubripirellula amarantea]|uniref:Uncharacterized protein n=1 Tax=Rubripirellula amarantea TaxID=2527999 RepID=A0A5C5WLA3_9BACT|nr:hypothetical protein Pla22_42360 [Rubripirellula amarantea]
MRAEKLEQLRAAFLDCHDLGMKEIKQLDTLLKAAVDFGYDKCSQQSTVGRVSDRGSEPDLSRQISKMVPRKFRKSCEMTEAFRIVLRCYGGIRRAKFLQADVKPLLSNEHVNFASASQSVLAKLERRGEVLRVDRGYYLPTGELNEVSGFAPQRISMSSETRKSLKIAVENCGRIPRAEVESFLKSLPLK